jgi:hypothetical protein
MHLLGEADITWMKQECLILGWTGRDEDGDQSGSVMRMQDTSSVSLDQPLKKDDD